MEETCGVIRTGIESHYDKDSKGLEKKCSIQELNQLKLWNKVTKTNTGMK